MLDRGPGAAAAPAAHPAPSTELAGPTPARTWSPFGCRRLPLASRGKVRAAHARWPRRRDAPRRCRNGKGAGV